jgi:hypothetical protein
MESRDRSSASGVLKPYAERADAVADAESPVRASDIIDVSRASGGDRTFLQSLTSLGGGRYRVACAFRDSPDRTADRTVCSRRAPANELALRWRAAIAGQLSDGFLNQIAKTS